MDKIWKDIKGYEGLYMVSNGGDVKSVKNGILKPSVYKGTGYYYVGLYKDGKRKGYTIHRLVADAFIPNPNNLPCVNHKDESKINNNVENLEWCTHRYNSNYGCRNEKISAKSKGVNIGRKMSDETRRKISESMKGKNTWIKGTKHTEEWKRNQSERMKGENHPFYGKHHTEESKRKISETKRNKQ